MEKHARDLRVLYLNRSPKLNFLRINSQMVWVTSVVASLALLSVVFSNHAIDPVIIVFSDCPLLVVIATSDVPILPSSNLLAERKAKELDRLERLIETHVRTLSGLERLTDINA